MVFPLSCIIFDGSFMSNIKFKEKDPLALGLTRSPMFMGINIRVFFFNLVICSLICIHAHTLMGVALFAGLHFIFARLSIKEPDFLYLNIKALIKTPPLMNRWYWGGVNSYEPW